MAQPQGKPLKIVGDDAPQQQPFGPPPALDRDPTGHNREALGLPTPDPMQRYGTGNPFNNSAAVPRLNPGR